MGKISDAFPPQKRVISARDGTIYNSFEESIGLILPDPSTESGRLYSYWKTLIIKIFSLLLHGGLFT